MSLFTRWLPTFLGFPVGGWLAVQAVGSVTGPGTAALTGAPAGAVIGTAQWLALRSHAVNPRWILHTAAGMTAGSALASVLTGAGTTVSALVVSGLVTGTVVGAAQGVLLARGRQVAAIWAVVVGAAWALAWFATSQVIVDAERGYVTFGASGALLATVATGAAVHRILGRRPVDGLIPESASHPLPLVSR